MRKILSFIVNNIGVGCLILLMILVLCYQSKAAAASTEKIFTVKEFSEEELRVAQEEKHQNEKDLMVYGCACAATVMVLIAIHSNQEKKDFTF
jgi:Cys-tRNA synthase (O-phospho-L-seryl-tRNA:Cys-tRNA synthase)